MAVVSTRRGSNILVEILDWCADLPGWQQDALRRIVETGAITDEDIVELTALCKEAAGVVTDGDPTPALRPLKRRIFRLGSANIPLSRCGRLPKSKTSMPWTGIKNSSSMAPA